MKRFPTPAGTCTLFLVCDLNNEVHFTGITRTQAKRFIDSFQFDRGPSFRIVQVRARYGDERVSESEPESPADPTIDEIREAAAAIRSERRHKRALEHA